MQCVCALDDALNLPVSLRSRLVTWSCCHGTQERDAKVPASLEDKGSVDLPLPSCAIAVHTIPTTASTNVDSVVNGNVQYHVAGQVKVCKMEELDGIIVWPGAAAQCSIKTFLDVHRDVFDLEEEGENVVVCLSTLNVSPGSGPPSGSVQPSCDGPTTKFSAPSLVARVCRMWRPVSVRVLFNLRNCR